MSAFYAPPGQGELVTGFENLRTRERTEDLGRASARAASAMGFSLPFPTLGLTLNPATVAENATDKTATFTATISKAVGVDTVVAPVWTGTASRPADVAVPAGPITIPAGQTQATAVVTIADDAGVEVNETLILTVSASLGGVALLVTPAGALTRTLTITSEDQ